MILVKRANDNVVLYAGVDLVLTAQATSSVLGNWQDFSTTAANAVIDNGALPVAWIGGAYAFSDGVWTVSNPALLPTLSPAQLESAIQSQLDTLAQSWGYNDMATACTYVGDPCAKFNAEATALRAWRSATWQAAESLDAQIMAGTVAMPATVADALALTPAAPARPA
jgi:hypothetical protein